MYTNSTLQKTVNSMKIQVQLASQVTGDIKRINELLSLKPMLEVNNHKIKAAGELTSPGQT